MTQTLKSFLVCASTPLLASITMTAESAAMSVRSVSYTHLDVYKRQVLFMQVNTRYFIHIFLCNIYNYLQ